MLVTILFIAAILIAAEVILVHKSKLFKRVNEGSWLGGLALSLGLSWLMGIILGLSGVIVGMASAVAMVFTDTLWGAKRKVKKTGGKFQQNVNEVVEFWTKVFKILKWAFIIATIPIWLPAKCYAWFKRQSGAAPAATT